MLLESPGRPAIQLSPGIAKTIGRSDDADVVVDEPSLSRVHARVRMASTGAVTIEDLGSTNGTHVSGTRISAPMRLAPGDEFALGSEVLRIRRRSATALTVKVDAGDEDSDRLRKKLKQ